MIFDLSRQPRQPRQPDNPLNLEPKTLNPMDILDLTLKDYKLFSPVTGELIYDAKKNFLNKDEKSLAALWDIDTDDYLDHYEEHYDPETERIYYSFPSALFNHPWLYSVWKEYLNNCSHRGEGESLFGKVDLENFIFNYDDPNLICFRITNPEKPWDRRYFVIEMNGEVECPE